MSTQAVIKFAAKSKHNLHVKDVKLVELRNTWCEAQPEDGPQDTSEVNESVNESVDESVNESLDESVSEEKKD